jgi:hypothetical protein
MVQKVFDEFAKNVCFENSQNTDFFSENHKPILSVKIFGRGLTPLSKNFLQAKNFFRV